MIGLSIHGSLDIPIFTLLAQLVGLAGLSGVVAGLSAFVFRWRTGIQLPEGPALLLGLGAVAVYLNTRIALVQFLGADGAVLTTTAVVSNVGILIVSGLTASGGWYFGDKLGEKKQFSYRLQPSLSPLVRATGRFITVELPEEIGDIDGYDPVPPATKAALAGESYTFSRGLTVEKLGEALEMRLKTDHDIAHIDADLTVDGTIEYLAVGRRAAGIGPTLSPGSSATALRADPAFSASPGDTVQIWDGTASERIGTAELRATAGKTVTVSARSDIIDKFDPHASYRLLTLAGDERIDRTFSAMLRRADETMGITEITEGATLSGMTVGELGLSVIAIKDSTGTETIPTRDRQFTPGDRIFVIGHPAQLRRVEAAAKGTATYEPPKAKTSPSKQTENRHRLRFWKRS